MTDVMKSQSLANRYRPQTFDEMIWQQHIIWILKAKMQSDSSSLQNYLLCGPRGTWKTTSARILAKAINCLDPHDGNPCNKCANCQLINEWKTTDYVEIDAASNTWVDNVREVIIDQALYQPISLKKKIYVIDEVHMLSGQAFNALLKTIEEPDWNVCFILATTELQKVPQTIISRVQVFNFRKIPQNEMVEHLISICKKELFEFENEALELLATISEWCVRDAIKYLDQVSVLWKISTENVSHFLWISTEATIKSFFDIVKTGDRNQIFSQIDQLAQSTDLQQFAKQCIWWIDAHVSEDVDFYLKVSEAFSEILKQVRFYPYPAVLYKLAFNQYIQWNDTNASEHKENEHKEKIQNIETNEQKIEKQAEEKPDWDLRERVLSQLSSISAQTALKDKVFIEKISDTEVSIFYEKWIQVDSVMEKEKEKIWAILEKELWRKVILNIQWMSKEECMKKLMMKK